MTETDAPEPESAATRRWRLLLIGSIAGFILLVGGVAVASLPSGQDSPAAAVEGYLAALLSRDAEAALEYVDPDGVPMGAEARFLDDRVLTGGWSVSSVVTTAEDVNDEDTAEVTARISAPGGERETVFHLSDTGNRGDENWSLNFPFETISISSAPFDYLQINALTVDSSQAGDSVYVFPGVYEFYRDAKGVKDLDADDIAVFAVGSDHDAAETESGDDTFPVGLGPVDPTAATVREAEERLREHLDDCVAAKDIAPYGCPFGVESVDDPDRDYSDLTNLHDVDWRLDERPRVELTSPHPDEDSAFAVSFADDVAATITGTGFDVKDRAKKFSVTHDIVLDGYTVTVARDGSITVLAPDGVEL